MGDHGHTGVNNTGLRQPRRPLAGPGHRLELSACRPAGPSRSFRRPAGPAVSVVLRQARATVRKGRAGLHQSPALQPGRARKHQPPPAALPCPPQLTGASGHISVSLFSHLQRSYLPLRDQKNEVGPEAGKLVGVASAPLGPSLRRGVEVVLQPPRAAPWGLQSLVDVSHVPRIVALRAAAAARSSGVSARCPRVQLGSEGPGSPRTAAPRLRGVRVPLTKSLAELLCAPQMVDSARLPHPVARGRLEPGPSPSRRR